MKEEESLRGNRWSNEEQEPEDWSLRRTVVLVSSPVWKLQCPSRSQQVHTFHAPSLGARLPSTAQQATLQVPPRGEGHLRTMCCSVSRFLLKWVLPLYLLLYLLIPSYFLLVYLASIVQSLKLKFLFLYFWSSLFCSKKSIKMKNSLRTTLIATHMWRCKVLPFYYNFVFNSALWHYFGKCNLYIFHLRDLSRFSLVPHMDRCPIFNAPGDLKIMFVLCSLCAKP